MNMKTKILFFPINFCKTKPTKSLKPLIDSLLVWMNRLRGLARYGYNMVATYKKKLTSKNKAKNLVHIFPMV